MQRESLKQLIEWKNSPRRKPLIIEGARQVGKLTQKKYEGVYYWTNDRSTAEVDFVIQNINEVIPIEVKAETNVHAKSFKLFCEKFNPSSAIRTSMLPYKEESWMTNIPLYGMV